MNSIWAWEREWLGVRHSSVWMPTLPLMYSVTHLLICKTGNMCWQYVLQKIIWWFLERRLCKAPPGPVCVSRSVRLLRPHGPCPSSFLCPWDPPGKNTGEGSCFLLQGIFPTQGSNPGLLHCRRILYHLRHEEAPELQRMGTIAIVLTCIWCWRSRKYFFSSLVSVTLVIF